MAQDVWQFGLPEGGSEPDQDQARQQSRRTLWAVLVSLTLLAALIGGAILLLAPWASAAGGCGGG